MKKRLNKILIFIFVSILEFVGLSTCARPCYGTMPVNDYDLGGKITDKANTNAIEGIKVEVYDTNDGVTYTDERRP